MIGKFYFKITSLISAFSGISMVFFSLVDFTVTLIMLMPASRPSAIVNKDAIYVENHTLKLINE